MKIAVIFDNLGPYHIARLAGLDKLCDLVAIELFGSSSEYSWRAEHSVPFRRITLVSSAKGLGFLSVALRRTLAEVCPDVVFIPGWSSQSALVALRWARRHHVPAILMSDSQAIDFGRRPLKESIKSRIVRQFAGALVGGTPHREYVNYLGVPAAAIRIGYDVVDNVHFIRGSDAARADEARLRCKMGLPASYFLTSARLVEKKNLPFLLRAYRLYRETQVTAPADLLILGDGPLRSALEAQIDGYGLSGTVKFLGFRQYEETPILFGLSLALVLPSTTEQWGLVVNEALASGLPVLVSNRCGSAPNLVLEGKNGYLFDPYEESELAALMRRLTLAPAEEIRKMGSISRDLIAGFSPETFAENALALAVEALDAPQRPAPVIDQLLLAVMCQVRGRV